MAELAHEASGPASSEPAGTAQQESGPATSDKGKLRVFISYSRKDQDLIGFESRTAANVSRLSHRDADIGGIIR
jgi:hypothetical protein